MASRITESRWEGHPCPRLPGKESLHQGRGSEVEDRCRQCHFAWQSHPKRYDAEEQAMVRVCSEYPAEPIKGVQACIGP